MKQILEFISAAGNLLKLALGFCLVVAVLIGYNAYKGCNIPEEAGSVVQNGVQTPKDTTFVPVKEQEEQLPTLGIGTKPKVKLPKGVKSSELSEVISVERTNGEDRPALMDIIVTNDGEVYVGKDSDIVSVTVTKFTPPFLELTLQPALGISVSKRNDGPTVSPAASVSFGSWSGWLQLPVATFDLNGIGVGAQAKVYHDISIGAAEIWKYSGGNQLELVVNFNL